MIRATANPAMVRHHADDVKLFRTRERRLLVAALAAAFVFLPVRMTEFQSTVAVYAGITAIGALGLNLLVGYTGQISLGHAFFFGAGAYTAAYMGGHLHQPLLVWLPAAAVVGALVGALTGPAGLRLRGNYLAIITLGLVFLGQHVFENWTSVTGGLNGTSVRAPVRLGPVDFADLHVLGRDFTRTQGYFYLVWLLVGVAALTAKNIVRSRSGRAMQAVRDRDLAAEVVGVHLARYKVLAFVLSSSLAAAAGALYGSYTRFVSPGDFTLLLSIQYIAVIIVGGVATVFGPVIGAVFVTAVPRIIEAYTAGHHLPGIVSGPGGGHGMSVAALNQVIFGVLIIGFLLTEPRGVAALWLRIRAYFRAWPFSY